MYAIVNGSDIKLIRQLPKQYTFSDGSKTGNFDSLNSATQIAEGYYPVVDVKPSYDPRIERLELDTTVAGTSEVTRTYVKVAIDLGVLKAQKVKQITNHESALLTDSLFEYDSAIWHLAHEAAQNVDGLQTAMSLPGATFPSPFSWTDADGNEVAMTQAQFEGFAGAVLTRKLTITGASKTHAGTVKAQTDPLAVVTYDYSAGWGEYVRPPSEDDII